MSRLDKLIIILFTLLLTNFVAGSIISAQPVESVFYTDWYGYQLSTKPGVWCIAKNVRRIVPGEELIFEQEVELFRPAAGPVGGKADSVECTEFVLTLAYWHYFYSDLKYKN